MRLKIDQMALFEDETYFLILKMCDKMLNFAVMTTEPITRDFRDLEKVRRLYEDSFPAEERLDFNDLLTLLERADVEFVATYLDDRFVGFTYVLRFPDYVWGFYFAVEPEFRGKKLGTQMLVDVLKRNSDRLFVIDIESVEQPWESEDKVPEGLAPKALRARRHDFYLRHGLRDSGVTREFKHIAYTIMEHGEGNIDSADYDRLIDTMWQTINRHLEDAAQE